VHGQIVLCPGVNDGDVLAETIEQTAARHPGILSMAVVPSASPSFREKLREGESREPELAREVSISVRAAPALSARAGHALRVSLG